MKTNLSSGLVSGSWLRVTQVDEAKFAPKVVNEDSELDSASLFRPELQELVIQKLIFIMVDK